MWQVDEKITHFYHIFSQKPWAWARYVQNIQAKSVSPIYLFSRRCRLQSSIFAFPQSQQPGGQGMFCLLKPSNFQMLILLYLFICKISESYSQNVPSAYSKSCPLSQRPPPTHNFPTVQLQLFKIFISYVPHLCSCSF